MKANGQKTLRVRTDRLYVAHHSLLQAAHVALKVAEKEEDHRFSNQLMCMTFCGLALEAIANAFGEKLIDGWNDFESSSPIAKLRTICSELGVKWDKQVEPFATALWLVNFRNKIAHAKPEPIRAESTMTDVEYEARRGARPPSHIEKLVTHGNAHRALDQVFALLRILIKKTPADKYPGLVADGWTRTVEFIGESAPADTK